MRKTQQDAESAGVISFHEFMISLEKMIECVSTQDVLGQTNGHRDDTPKSISVNEMSR